MSALTDLTDQYTLEIAKISDTLDALKATYVLERLAAAIAKQAALEANDIVSYSLAGRTITRRNASDGEDLIQQLTYDLEALIFGNVTLLDNDTSGLGEDGL